MIQGEQSVLVPYGRQAAEIADLGWGLLGGGSAILALVVAAVWLAMRGSPAWRARLADRRTLVLGGIVFPAVVLTGLLTLGTLLMRSDLAASAGAPDLRIEVVGEQWWWRVAYARPDGAVVPAANEVRVPVGRDVEFTLKSADVIHSFWVPSLGGKVDMIPGRVTRLRMKAESDGVFRGQCAEYCGGAHALMGFKLVALPPAEFEAWLASEAGPASEPATADGKAGKALFAAAGCGGCHAVRGTAAEGRIGPDLTHAGRRLSVGIDTLPMSAANLARFIADPQHIKPGNAMPPFRIFSGAELEALSAYLMELR